MMQVKHFYDVFVLHAGMAKGADLIITTCLILIYSAFLRETIFIFYLITIAQ